MPTIKIGYHAPQVSVSDILAMRPGTFRNVAERVLEYLADHALAQSPLAQRILAFTCTHCRNESGTAWPGTERIARAVGCHPNSACKELRLLRNAGILSVVRGHEDRPHGWTYVVKDWGAYWHDSEKTTSNRIGEISTHKTRELQNSENSTAMPMGATARSIEGTVTIAPASSAATEVKRLRAEIRHDPHADEQAHACLVAGVDVPMIRWLLRRYRRAKDYIADLMARMHDEARKPAAWLVSAIIRGYAPTPDHRVVKRAAGARKGPPQRPDLKAIRIKWHSLSAEAKEWVRSWVAERYGEYSPEARGMQKSRGDETVWMAVGRALDERA